MRLQAEQIITEPSIVMQLYPRKFSHQHWLNKSNESRFDLQSDRNDHRMVFNRQETILSSTRPDVIDDSFQIDLRYQTIPTNKQSNRKMRRARIHRVPSAVFEYLSTIEHHR